LLILTEADVKSIYDGPEAMRDAIAVMADAHRELGEGRAMVPLKMHLDYPAGSGYRHYARILPAILPGRDACAARIYTMSRQWTGPRAAERDIYILWRFADLGMQALIASEWVNVIRTAAPTGLATDLMARADSRVVAMIGSGKHARGQLAAVCAVRPIEQVRVFSPTAEHREGFADEMSRTLGIPVQAVGSARDALRGADVVCAATLRPPEPAILGEWLEPGMHLNSIGVENEIDDVVVQRSRMVLSNREQILDDTPPREPFQHLLREGRLADEDVSTQLADVVLGRAEGRRTPEEISLFISAGSPIWDVAIAARLYELARERGVGRDIPLSNAPRRATRQA
jgi:ornithine cyclodeaminase/alanine dehydrogenase-like protein (mu-crystallin family)